ncbi:type-2 ice-structuring protein-like, partial [Hyalella azteca]|uniref:Type-2 ice-structuring protein-like n=1 Tax=Hyalella azteca TaxID=294128 RepID=A0A8B7NI81_HYAAZ
AAAIECPAGYEVIGSKCIHRLPGGYLTHDDAVAYCHQNFGRLPVLHDCASFIGVATYVDDGFSADAINGYWLGATNSSATGVWQWNDGTAVQMGAPYWAVSVTNALAKAKSAQLASSQALSEEKQTWLLLPAASLHMPLKQLNPYTRC